MTNNPHFWDYEWIYEEITVLPTNAYAKARALVRLTRNENFHDFARVFFLLQRLGLEPQVLDLHYSEIFAHKNFPDVHGALSAMGDKEMPDTMRLILLGRIATNPSITDPKVLEEINQKILATEAGRNHNLRAEALGRVGSNPNFRDLQLQESRIMNSGAHSSFLLMALSRLAKNPNFTDFEAFFKKAQKNFWVTPEQTVDALARAMGNPRLEDFERVVREMRKSGSDLPNFARALVEVVKNPNLPADLYEKWVDWIRKWNAESFVEAMSFPHPAQAEYLRKLYQQKKK